MIWSKRETVEALRRIAAIAEDGSHVAPDEYREQFAELRLDVNAILALNEAAIDNKRDALAGKAKT